MVSCFQKLYKMEEFCLKWNDFETNVSKSFKVLKMEREFFDVTLVSDDEEHISAHKVVLSSSSEFFKIMLRKSNHTNPLIYMNGIKSQELNQIMDYIYEGEVQILQENLDYFLDVAQKLRINGLTGGDTKQENYTEDEKEADGSEYFPKVEDYETSLEEISEVKKYQPRSNRNTERSVSLLNIDLVKTVDELTMKDGELWKCKSCGKTAKSNSQIRKHIELHIDGLSFPCQQCGSTFRSRNILACHKHDKHIKNFI